jgi:Transmembrane proteins 14C
MDERVINVLNFYGVFLILCGITSVIFIGMKAKTALISGGMSGAIVIVIGYLVRIEFAGAHWAGLIVSLGLFGVFSWRSTKTLYQIFELIPSGHEDLKGKGIAFLIISLMAVMSMVVFMVQLTV